jgi:hypothetical protein
MTKTIGYVVAISSLLAVVGCFNTNGIQNGGLVCGSNGECPDGFVCISPTEGRYGHCWRKGTDPDAGGGSPDTFSSGADSGAGAICSLANAKEPFGPFAKCSDSATNENSTCDPVCQSGCPCDRRCVLNDTFSAFVCEATSVPSGTDFIRPADICSETNSKLCGPGTVCISDSVCPWTCTKLCRQHMDCPSNSRCTVLGMVDLKSQPIQDILLCSPPIEVCNPTGTATCGTLRSNLNCVFLAGLTGEKDSDATICDCVTLHDKRVGSKCSELPDDCQPGAVCIEGNCRPICSKISAGSACPGSSTCTSIYGSSQYGYCRN